MINLLWEAAIIAASDKFSSPVDRNFQLISNDYRFSESLSASDCRLDVRFAHEMRY